MEIRDNKQRTQNVIGMIYFTMIINIITTIRDIIFSDFESQSLLVYIINLSITSIYITVVISCAVLFIQWFRRAYYNMKQITHKRMEFSDSWAIWAWFIPFINLYLPYRMLKEIYVSSNKILRDSNPFQHQYSSLSNIQICWFLWIASNYLGRLYSRLYSEKEENMSFILSLIILAIEVTVNITTVKMLKEYSDVESYLCKTRTKKEEMSLT